MSAIALISVACASNGRGTEQYVAVGIVAESTGMCGEAAVCFDVNSRTDDFW